MSQNTRHHRTPCTPSPSAIQSTAIPRACPAAGLPPRRLHTAHSTASRSACTPNRAAQLANAAGQHSTPRSKTKRDKSQPIMASGLGLRPYCVALLASDRSLPMLPLLAWISSMRMELATAASSTCKGKGQQHAHPMQQRMRSAMYAMSCHVMSPAQHHCTPGEMRPHIQEQKALPAWHQQTMLL